MGEDDAWHIVYGRYAPLVKAGVIALALAFVALMLFLIRAGCNG